MARVQTMEELLEKTGYEIPTFKYGDVVEGEVVAKSHREILLDVGAKSEGIISGLELEDEDKTYKDLKVGDKVLVTVIQAENDQGYIVLSLKRAEREYKWRELFKAFHEGSVLKAKVLEYNKGGLVVDILGLRGFVPLSHLDRVHFAAFDRSKALGSKADQKEKGESLLGETLKVKVIELNRLKNRIVLSEKEALADETADKREKVLRSLKVGDVCEGVITALMPFGIFVEIGGIEGLVHISEISWEKVVHPRDFYKVSDKVKAKILEIDPREQKVALSIKALKEDPWKEIEKSFPEGKKVKGVVSKIVPFGAFVKLKPGLEGLIHVSETAGPLKVGEEVEAIVLHVNERGRKLGLSVKKLKEKKGK